MYILYIAGIVRSYESVNAQYPAMLKDNIGIVNYIIDIVQSSYFHNRLHL